MLFLDSTKEMIESADQKYEVVHQEYMKCLTDINNRLLEFRGSRKSLNSSRSSSVVSLLQHPCNTPQEIQSATYTSQEVGKTSSPMSNIGNPSVHQSLIDPPNNDIMHSLALPPCDIDVFEGDFQSWPTFRDLFSTVYINNSRLSDIERLCHLTRKTSGEAREIISRFPLTHRSFGLAWKALKDNYDNPRLLVHNQFKILFALPILQNESASGLKTLQRGINACLSAMSIYDIRTENWDPFLVFLCLQRLPKITQTLWEQSVKDKSAISLWIDLDSFLTERIRTLMCLHDMRGSEQATKSVVKKVQTHMTKSKSSDNFKSPQNSSCIL